MKDLDEEKIKAILKSSIKDICVEEFNNKIITFPNWETRFELILKVKTLQELGRIADILEMIEVHNDKVGVKQKNE